MLTDMLSSVQGMIRTLAGGDGFAIGLITSTLLGMAMVAMRKVPVKIMSFLRARTMVTMTLDNSIAQSMAQQMYRGFLGWFDRNPWAKYDRNRQLISDHVTGTKLGPGLGFHWFIYKRRLFWFHVMSLESTGVDYEKERITLCTFGTNARIYDELVDAFQPTYDRKNCGLFVPRATGGGGIIHDYMGHISFNFVETMVIDPSVKQAIFPYLDWFLANREWYDKKNLDYKKVFLLEGPPGTGKTSLSKAIASYIKWDLFSLDLTEAGQDFGRVLNSIPNYAVVSIEDFDNVPTLHRRDLQDIAANPDEQGKHVSISQFLNALQGVIQLNNIIVVLSTNHLEKIDPAIYRKGRVDHIVHVNALKDPQIRDFMTQMYGDDKALPINVRVEPTNASVLANSFLMNPHEPSKFVETLVCEVEQ